MCWIRRKGPATHFNMMLVSLGDLLSKSSTLSVMDDHAIGSPTSALPSFPVAIWMPRMPLRLTISPVTASVVASNNMTRASAVVVSTAYGLLMNVPEVFRDKCTYYSPKSPSTIQLVKDWMAMKAAESL